VTGRRASRSVWGVRSPAIIVEESVTVAAPAGQVWHALVDASARSGWWGYLDLDARPGGRFEERWTDAQGRRVSTHGRVTEVGEGRVLRLTWKDEDWGRSTDVEILIEDAATGATVQVRHTGWERLPDGAALAEEHRGGWRMHLDNLRAYLDRSARHQGLGGMGPSRGG
jgi:uncharacterized protein YndB with AHSA1/START domain